MSERRWLRLLFSFRDPVDRRTDLPHGAGLMLLKYDTTSLRSPTCPSLTSGSSAQAPRCASGARTAK